jgi:hypothetical protein
MMPLLCLLAATAPTGPRNPTGIVPAETTGGRAGLIEKAAVNTSPDAIHIVLIALAVVVVLAVIALIICLIANPPQSRSRRQLTRRMQQDQAFLQSNYFNTASGIMNEAMRHRQ